MIENEDYMVVRRGLADFANQAIRTAQRSKVS
jgi:hypothetical protein